MGSFRIVRRQLRISRMSFVSMSIPRAKVKRTEIITFNYFYFLQVVSNKCLLFFCINNYSVYCSFLFNCRSKLRSCGACRALSTYTLGAWLPCTRASQFVLRHCTLRTIILMSCLHCSFLHLVFCSPKNDVGENKYLQCGIQKRDLRMSTLAHYCTF